MLLPIVRPLLRRSRRVYGVVVADGHILVVKNWLARDTWRFAGGGLRKGEDSRTALHRELDEELGVKGKIIEKLHESTCQLDNLGFNYELYLVELPSMQLRPNRLEIVATKWVPISTTVHEAYSNYLL